MTSLTSPLLTASQTISVPIVIFPAFLASPMSESSFAVFLFSPSTIFYFFLKPFINFVRYRTTKRNGKPFSCLFKAIGTGANICAPPRFLSRPVQLRRLTFGGSDYPDKLAFRSFCSATDALTLGNFLCVFHLSDPSRSNRFNINFKSRKSCGKACVLTFLAY